MTKKHILILEISIILVFLIGMITYVNMKSYHSLKSITYTGCLFDSSGQILDDQASITLDGKMIESNPFISKTNQFKGDLEIELIDIKEKYSDLELAMIDSANNTFFMAGVSSFFNNKKESEYSNIGVICMDSLEPCVIMMGFSNDYCKEHNMEIGTIMVVENSGELQPDDLLEKSKMFDVNYD